VTALREVGQLLACLKEPEPPQGPARCLGQIADLQQGAGHGAQAGQGPPCQEVVLEGQDVDLGRLPIQTCWPGDAGPLITWGLVITRGPDKPRQNLGIYRSR
jgi:4-hydroxy-3-polyprenylbenzoate decarboxylase